MLNWIGKNLDERGLKINFELVGKCTCFEM